MCFTRRRPFAMFVLALTLGLTLLFGTAAHQQARASEPETLRIASWGMSGLWHVPGEALRRRQGERLTLPPKLPRGGDEFAVLRQQAQALDADIVTLQGVGSPQAVQRVFPARDYFLIFSRQLLERFSADRRALDDPRFRQSYTAIVIRRDRALRMIAREHVSSLAVAHTGGKGPATTPAGLAVKLISDGREFWLLAVDLTVSCEQPAPTPQGAAAETATDVRQSCARLDEQATALAEWIGRKQADGEQVIVSGSFIEGAAVDTPDHEVRELWTAIGGATSLVTDPGPPLLAPLRGTRPVRVSDAELALIGVGASERRQQMRISRQFGYDQTRALRKRRGDRVAASNPSAPASKPSQLNGQPVGDTLSRPEIAEAREETSAQASEHGERDGSVADLVFDAFRAFLSASRSGQKQSAAKPAPAGQDATAGQGPGQAARNDGISAPASDLAPNATAASGGQQPPAPQPDAHPRLTILPRGALPAECAPNLPRQQDRAAANDVAPADAAELRLPNREYLLVDRTLLNVSASIGQGHLTWQGAADDPRRAAQRGCPVFIDLPMEN